MTARTIVALSTIACILLTALSAQAQAQAPEEGYAPEGAGPPPAPPPPDPKAVRNLRLRFEREPPVAEVQKAALRFFKVHPEKVSSYRRGASWKALMPDLELIFNNEYGTNDRTLFFNAEILDVSSLVGVQEGLLREITSLYFTRRRLMTAMVLSPPQSPHEQITEQIRLDEITANVDALTGGYFSKEVKRRLEE
jgi:hypothetical protein